MSKPFILPRAISVVVFFMVIAGAGLFFSPKPTQATVVSPARLEIEGDPGETVTGKCSVINDSDAVQTYYSSTENFEAEGETGNPRFVESDDGLANWITVMEEISVQPKERKDIIFSVQIPADAGVGGHFAALFWGNQPPKEEGGSTVSVGQKVGVLVFLKVRGQVIEKGQIAGFNTLKERKFYDSLPVDMVFRFDNSGNDRLKPVGEVEITNLFGAKKEEIPANKKQGSVLPGSVRKFYLSWGRENIEELEKKGEEMPDTNDPFLVKLKKQYANFAFGRYTAELHLKYGTNQEEVTSRVAFFVIPWQLLSVSFVLLIVVLFVIRMAIRRYNRWIVSKYKKSD